MGNAEPLPLCMADLWSTLLRGRFFMSLYHSLSQMIEEIIHYRRVCRIKSTASSARPKLTMTMSLSGLLNLVVVVQVGWSERS